MPFSPARPRLPRPCTCVKLLHVHQSTPLQRASRPLSHMHLRLLDASASRRSPHHPLPLVHIRQVDACASFRKGAFSQRPLHMRRIAACASPCQAEQPPPTNHMRQVSASAWPSSEKAHSLHDQSVHMRQPVASASHSQLIRASASGTFLAAAGNPSHSLHTPLQRRLVYLRKASPKASCKPAVRQAARVSPTMPGTAGDATGGPHGNNADGADSGG